jgi:hypothetical protein
MSTLKKAQASNKAREVFVGVFMSRLAHRDRAAKARFLNWYIDAIFPPVSHGYKAYLDTRHNAYTVSAKGGNER